MDKKPLKRHLALQPLSREHHHGLIFCWKIREGLKRNIEPTRIKIYADWFWNNHLVPHVETEEKFIFPILPKEHEKVKKALMEHQRLKQLFENKEESHKMLSLIEKELESHIRFEERDLFNEIQQVATGKQLEEIEQHHTTPFCDNWVDEFWK